MGTAAHSQNHIRLEGGHSLGTFFGTGKGGIRLHIVEAGVHNAHFIQLALHCLGVAVLVKETVGDNKGSLLPSTSPSSVRATGRQPFLKYTFSGVRNQSMFSLLSATVLMLSRCCTPTLSDTEFRPSFRSPSQRRSQLKVVQVAYSTVRRRSVDQNAAVFIRAV